uniref:Type IV secretion protein Rhs n=1 Tax=Thermosporothrix sp. COM3 TaxID=2490863 RepID=A0A455SK68_9CHLR|nr:hypothetical protein KTC_20630 [Thermosporothrix sp. COM3]
MDRVTKGPRGTLSYQDNSHPHAVTHLGGTTTRYASYDAMGNMICRTSETTGKETCEAGPTRSGAQMVYDFQGRMIQWKARSGKQERADYLYDSAGNRVAQRTSETAENGLETSQMVFSFGAWTEVKIVGASKETTKYSEVAGKAVAYEQGQKPLLFRI